VKAAHKGDDDGGKAIRAGQVREDLPEPHTGKTIKQLLGKEAKGITTYAIEPKNDKEPAQIYYDRKQVAEALRAKGIELDSEEQDDDEDENYRMATVSIYEALEISREYYESGDLLGYIRSVAYDYFYNLLEKYGLPIDVEVEIV
jgi:hypothetical protein